MVQINLSFPFIFAVAAIAPVVALPVSDIGLSRPIDEPQTGGTSGAPGHNGVSLFKRSSHSSISPPRRNSFGSENSSYSEHQVRSRRSSGSNFYANPADGSGGGSSSSGGSSRSSSPARESVHPPPSPSPPLAGTPPHSPPSSSTAGLITSVPSSESRSSSPSTSPAHNCCCSGCIVQ